MPHTGFIRSPWDVLSATASLVYIFRHSCGILNPQGMQAYPSSCHRASVVMRGKERCGDRWRLMQMAASDCLGMSWEIVRDAGMTFKGWEEGVLDASMVLGGFLDHDYGETMCLGWLSAWIAIYPKWKRVELEHKVMIRLRNLCHLDSTFVCL